MDDHQHIEEQIQEDFKILKDLEEELRCARDPREKRTYTNAIKEVKQRISERKAELESLYVQPNNLQPIRFFLTKMKE